MLRTILRLRVATTIHQLRRDWWRILFLIGGVVWSLSLVPAILWGARALSYNFAGVKADALVAVAAVLMIGWLVVPLLITGLDDSLSPTRFASLGLEPRRLSGPLAVTSALTVPSLFFAIVLVSLSTSWHNENPSPWPLVVGIVGALLTWLSLVFSARLATSWAARVLGSRRSREATLVGVVGLVAIVGTAVWVVVRDGLETVLDYDVTVIINQLALTPIGAGMSAPEAVVDGNWWGVAWRLAMMTVWVGVLLGAWRANVAFSLVHPLFRGGGARRRDDSVLAAGERAAARAAGWRGKLGPLAPPARPVVAVRARQIHYWFSDPRYLSNLVGVLVVPFVVIGLVMPIFSLDARWAFVAPLLLAATIGWGRHNDVAYDSTALWIDVTAGEVGPSIIRGRLAAVLAWAAPGVFLVAAGTLAWTRDWELGPALFGACIGVLGATLGVSAITSVALPYRAPGPGESPFGAEVGSVGAGLFAQVVSSLMTLVVLPLSVIPFALAVAVDARWGWVSAIVGTVAGVVVYLVGVRAGGVMYDRRAGDLVGAVS